MKFLLPFLLLATTAIADDVQIVAPDKANPGDTIIVQFLAPEDVRETLPYTVEPQPKVTLKLRDESGNRVLLIMRAEAPGYTISVNQQVVRPVPDEIPDGVIGDKAKLEEWLARNSQDEIYKATHRIKIGGDPDPDPDPDPPDPEPDPDDPAPIPVAGFRVLIVYESAEMTKYPIETQVIIAGADVREFLDKHCVDEDGTPGYRIYDADINTANDLEVWQNAMQRDRSELPWVIVSNGKTGFEGPLPDTPTEFLELCKKYLPKKGGAK